MVLCHLSSVTHSNDVMQCDFIVVFNHGFNDLISIQWKGNVS